MTMPHPPVATVPRGIHAATSGHSNGGAPEPGGINAYAASVPEKMKQLSIGMLAVAGLPATINHWPYRHGGKQLWACDISGGKKHISLTLVECGFNDLPAECVEDEVIPVEDGRAARLLLQALLAAADQHD